MNLGRSMIFAYALAGAMLMTSCASQMQIDPTRLPDPITMKPYSPQFLAGPRLGINRNYHSGGFRPVDGVKCPVFIGGSGWGVLGGLTAEFPLNAHSSLVPAVSYESRPGNFRERLPDLPMLDNNGSVTQSMSMNSSVAYRFISAEVLYKYDLPINLGGARISATAGPSIGYVVGGTMTQSLDLDTPANGRFPDTSPGIVTDGGHRLVFMDGAAIAAANRFRASMRAGLQLEIGLFGNRTIMYPGVFYDLGLTRVTSTENWNLNSLVFQVDFRRAF